MSWKQKPSTICLPCGIQTFFRGKLGIERLSRIVNSQLFLTATRSFRMGSAMILFNRIQQLRAQRSALAESIIVHEISGVNASAPLDGQKMNVQNSPGGGTNAITSTSITTTANGDYIVGFTFDDSANQADWNAGTGYAKREDLQIVRYMTASEDRNQSLSGSAAATFTATAAGFGDFITGIMAFRPM
jgi:hypothetical protein